MKPIPKPVYPCKHCADEYSWPASDLFWSSEEDAWVCDDCWDCEELKEEKGVCLADEIKKSESEHDAQVIEKFIQSYKASSLAELSTVYKMSAYAKQLRQKTQEITK